MPSRRQTPIRGPYPILPARPLVCGFQRLHRTQESVINRCLMPSNYVTLSRQELYDMVWSEPMTTLAKNFGISDVALAKRCRAVDVPIPYRGYWARKTAGQKPTQTPLPKYRRVQPPPADSSEAAPRVASSPKPHRPLLLPKFKPRVPEESISILKRDPPAPAKPIPPEQEALAARLQAKPPVVRADLRGTHAAIRRTALHLKAQRVKDFDWKSEDRAGPIVRITVDKTSTQRALRVADAVLRAAENLNWQFQAPTREPDPYRPRYRDGEYQGPIWGCIMVEGEALQITVTERQKQVPHDLTEDEKDSRRRGYNFHTRPWDLAPTGDLRLNLTYPDGFVFKTLSDRVKRRLEDQLPEVFHAMLDHSLAMKRRREEKRLAEIAERERQRLARLADERREAHSKMVAELERQAGAWYRTRLLRRYVKTARRQLGSRTIEAKLQHEKVDFLLWASAYIEQLDPLSPTPRHPDQTPEQYSYGSEEAALKNTLLRLLHHDGHAPRKVRLEASGDTAGECEDASVDEEFDDDD
jgi:hypothetical protein